MPLSVSRNLKSASLLAYEPFVLSYQPCDADGNPESVVGRKFVIAFYSGGEGFGELTGENRTDDVLWHQPGTFSATLLGKNNLKMELSEYDDDGKSVIETAELEVGASAPYVPDHNAAPISRYIVRIIRKNDPQDGDTAPVFEVKRVRWISSPAPVFTSQPSFNPSTGTANATTFTATDGTASNALAYSRRWLLNGTAIGTGTTVVPAAAGSLILEVTATGAGGSNSATTSAATISASATLGALTLTVNTVAENTASGVTVGAIIGKTTGSTLSLISDGGGRFALSGNNLITGLTGTDYESAASHPITVRETLAGASNSPRDTNFTINVTDVPAPANAALPTISGTASVGQTLAASQGTWNGSPTAFAYQWKRGGVAISGATNSTYVLVSANGGTSITVTVTASSGEGSASATSGAVTVAAALSDKLYILGNSLIAGGASFAGQWAQAHPTIPNSNLGQGGAFLEHIDSQPNLEDQLVSVFADKPSCVIIAIGGNDLHRPNIYPTASSFTSKLWSLLAPVKAQGTKIVLATVTPRNNADHLSTYPAVNAAFKAAIGNQIDAVCDFDTTPVGVVANITNPAIYETDQLHPTAGSQTNYMYPQATGSLNYIFNLPVSVKQFSFTDAVGATASALTASDAISIIGLNYLDTRPYSVSTGHEVRKTPFGGTATAWTLNGVGTVANGDTLEVRAAASATAGATVNVTLTVGTVSDTFSIQTANNLAALTGQFRGMNAAYDQEYLANYTFTSVQMYAGKAVVAIYSTQGTLPTSVKWGTVVFTMRASAVGAQVGQKISFWDAVITTPGTDGLRADLGGGIRAIGYAYWSTDANAAYVDSKSILSFSSANPATTPPITMPTGGKIFAAANAGTTDDITVDGAGTIERGDIVGKFWAGDRASTGSVSLNGMQYSGGHILAVSYQPT